MGNANGLANFIWSVADLLRGDYKQSDYGKVVLPFTVLRRLDCVLKPTKEKVMDSLPRIQKMNIQNIDPLLNNVAGFSFHNRSQYTFDKLKGDPDNIAANLRNYINGFSANAREIIEYFSFDDQINRLEGASLLFLIVSRFCDIDLHPNKADNIAMGQIFEELIRRFSELSNETAGEHFTPREVIRLMVNLLFVDDREILTREGIVKTIYDPACGTGGMLSIAEEYLRKLNPGARLEVFGQEINPESYAICRSDMLIKGQNVSNIKFGNTFVLDKHSDGGIKPVTDAGVRKDKDELAPLSEIIDMLNQRFGTDFTQADRLFFGQVEEEAVEDETLAKQAKSNDIDNFRFGFEDTFLRIILDRTDKNREIVARILDDNEFREFVKGWMLRKVYSRLNE